MKKLSTLLQKADLSNHPELSSLWNYYQQAQASWLDACNKAKELKIAYKKLKKSKKASASKIKTSKNNLQQAVEIKKMRKSLSKEAAALLKKWARFYLIQNGIRKTDRQLKKLEKLLIQEGTIPKSAKADKVPEKKKTAKPKSKKKSKKSSPKPTAAKQQTGTTTAKKKTTPQSVPAESTEDNLKKIEGIGPKIEEVLKNAGIKSFQQLAESDYETLSSVLTDAGSRFSFADPTTWPSQASLAASDKMTELSALQQELKGGRRKADQ